MNPLASYHLRHIREARGGFLHYFDSNMPSRSLKSLVIWAPKRIETGITIEKYQESIQKDTTEEPS